MLFTELNTDVLLHIYGFLVPIDSINLAETCTRLRNVAQLHYKRFKIFNLDHYLHFYRYWKLHNRIDSKKVLEHIGPLIHDLTVDVNKLGSDVITSIGKYCVNVETLKIIGVSYGRPGNLYPAYLDWLRKLNLTKITISIRDLFFIDLSETTTLEELHIHGRFDDYRFSIDYGFLADVFERNVNIRSLRIPLKDRTKYDIFKKLKCLKHLVLDIEYIKSGGHFKKLAANLKMTALEKVELKFVTQRRVDGLNEFLQKLSENALHLKHLSIAHDFAMLDAYPLSSLQMLNLTSLRWIDEHPHLYKEIPKMQPNLTHLHLTIYDLNVNATLAKPMQQIIFLIENLERLEILNIQLCGKKRLLSAVEDFLQESVLYRIFDCHYKRPTMILRFFERCVAYYFVQVELNFKEREWTWTTMEGSSFKDFVEHQSPLPFYYSNVGSIDDLLVVQRFSGTVSDLNSVKEEAMKRIQRLAFKW